MEINSSNNRICVHLFSYEGYLCRRCTVTCWPKNWNVIATVICESFAPPCTFAYLHWNVPRIYYDILHYIIFEFLAFMYLFFIILILFLSCSLLHMSLFSTASWVCHFAFHCTYCTIMWQSALKYTPLYYNASYQTMLMLNILNKRDT